MADVVSADVRSRMMSAIRAKNTKPEIIVRKILHAQGYRFRLHRRDLPGAPDIVLPSRKIVIFVHGCFWHMHRQCPFAKLPSTRPDFWKLKLDRNVERDIAVISSLTKMGWRVFVVWECATRRAELSDVLSEKLTAWIKGDCPTGEISAS